MREEDGERCARSRFVAKDLNTFARGDVQANSPSLKAARLLVSFAAPKSRTRQVAGYDVSVALFHAELEGEELAVRAPAGLAPEGWLLFLLRALYGTRKAGQAWQELIYTEMESAGFSAVVVAANAFFQPTGDIGMLAHGDDFLAEGEPTELNSLDRLLEQRFHIKKLGACRPRRGQ